MKYSQNGLLESRGMYVNGKLDGWYELFNDKGFIYMRIQYKDNKKHGI